MTVATYIQETKVTIPAYIIDLSPKDQGVIDRLLQQFGNARRRAYSLKRQGLNKGTIEKILQLDHQLNSRYAKDAYYSIKELPSHVTFGGLYNQRLREKKKITKIEYRKRRNAILLSRGDKSKQGNLNLRLDLTAMTLRITTCHNQPRWLYSKIFLPAKYLEKYRLLLDGSHPYTVIICRRDNNEGYDVRVTVTVQSQINHNAPRLLALDVNAGHTDFAVVDKKQGRVLSIGKINHHETQHTSTGKRNTILHKTVVKIGNLAAHYKAEVVVGRLNTGKYKVRNKKAIRTVRQMPQFKFRQLLTHNLVQQGIKVRERSEAYTSKLGKELMSACGLDVHKCAAALFALKVANYPLFRALKALILSGQGCFLDEGDGSPRKTFPQRFLRELTALHQNRRSSKRNRMIFWCTMMASEELALVSDPGGHSAIPGSWGRSFFESLLNSTFASLTVKIC